MQLQAQNVDYRFDLDDRRLDRCALLVGGFVDSKLHRDWRASVTFASRHRPK